MFGGTSSTEYDEIVAKTTDENLTSENWELIMNLCDKVGDEGQAGAHAAIAAVLKRLAHRNPNVQLYALSLSESLGKNLGIDIHREIASRAFTQGLEKLITDRNTHEKVRRRALGLIAEWAAEFENDTSLGIMEDCYNNLKAKNYKFEQSQEPPPPTIEDEIRRREEEELQRVLEMSKQDLGGRATRWDDYSLASSSNSGPSGVDRKSSTTASGSAAAQSGSPTGYTAPKYQGGYAPARTPSPDRVAAQQRQQQLEYQKQLQAQQLAQQQAKEKQAKEQQAAAGAGAGAATTPVPSSVSPTPNVNIVTRVRALYTFEPTEPGELAFDKGDIIKVVDRGYKDWWRGQLKGRTGIFPVNYVEPMPEPTAAELTKEVEQEAAVFAQAVNVEKLLNMLKAFDSTKDNLADNEEIQELYRSSMALRPKIVKLIDKYSQKRADLVTMNETFLRARTIFDRMMEESLARHTGIYDQPPYRPIGQYNPPILQVRPLSRNSGGPQPYGWNPGLDPSQSSQPGYNGYPGGAGPPPTFPVAPQPLVTATPVPNQGPTTGGYGVMPSQGPTQQGPIPQQPQPSAANPAGYGAVPVGGYAGHQTNPPSNQQGPGPYPSQSQQPANQQPQPQTAQSYQAAQRPQAQPVQPYQPPVQQPVQPPVQQPVQQQPQPQPASSYPQPAPQPQPQPAQQQLPTQPQLTQSYQQPQSQPVQSYQQPQPQPQPAQSYQQPQPQPQHAQSYQQSQPQPQPQPAQSYQQPLPQPQPAQSYQPQPQPQPQPAQSYDPPAAQPIQQPQPVQDELAPLAQPQPVAAVVFQPQPESQPQVVQDPTAQPQQQPLPEAAQPQPQAKPAQPISGPPPHPYDASYTYADQNVQAWANYYAQGGTDPTGSVYFFSIPGVKEEAPAPSLPTQGSQDGHQSSYTGSGQAQEQNLGRNVSYMSQSQPNRSRPQSQETPDGAMGGAPASASGLQALANLPRYQLTDNPVPKTTQSRPQSLTASRPDPSRTGSGDSGYSPQQTSPTTLLSAISPLNIKRAQSPPQPSSTTPSWVLPKKNAPAFGGGHGNAGGSHSQAVGSG